jgi:hypothetical protein
MTPTQLKKELLKLDAQTLTEVIIGAISRNTPFRPCLCPHKQGRKKKK